MKDPKTILLVVLIIVILICGLWPWFKGQQEKGRGAAPPAIGKYTLPARINLHDALPPPNLTRLNHRDTEQMSNNLLNEEQGKLRTFLSDSAMAQRDRQQKESFPPSASDTR